MLSTTGIVPTTHLRMRNLSSSRVLISTPQFIPISLASPSTPTLTIRMGGGPRTFPGGVSKWQWKRMQAKKAKQLLKARLARERQIYEMRKRAELKAAVSELERPWEVVERAPALFSVKADEQVKVLADRFQKAGGFDMWSEKDGPQVFRSPDGIPSARFFPEGAVHSVRPYGVVAEASESDSGNQERVDFDEWIGNGSRSDFSRRSGRRSGRRRNLALPSSGKEEISQSKTTNSSTSASVSHDRNGNAYAGGRAQRSVIGDGSLEDERPGSTDWSKSSSSSKNSDVGDEGEVTWRSKSNSDKVFHQRRTGNKVSPYDSSSSKGNQKMQGSGNRYRIGSSEQTSHRGSEKITRNRGRRVFTSKDLPPEVNIGSRRESNTRNWDEYDWKTL